MVLFVFGAIDLARGRIYSFPYKINGLLILNVSESKTVGVRV